MCWWLGWLDAGAKGNLWRATNTIDSQSRIVLADKVIGDDACLLDVFRENGRTQALDLTCQWSVLSSWSPIPEC